MNDEMGELGTPQLSPPTGFAGGLVPWTIVLPRSKNIYAVLQDFEAFLSGIQYTLRARFRPGSFNPVPVPGQASQLPGTPGGPQISVTFSDGRTGKSEPTVPPDMTDPELVVLRYFRGWGGNDEFWMRFWLSPMPPPGPITWRVGWPEKDAPAVSVSCEAGELRDAAKRAEELW